MPFHWLGHEGSSHNGPDEWSRLSLGVVHDDEQDLRHALLLHKSSELGLAAVCPDRPGAPLNPMRIELDSVSFSYRGGGDERLILDGASAQLLPGRFTVVMGPSGCGKSTLFRLIDGTLRPDSGQIRPSGTAHGIGRIFQDYRLVPFLSARDNVLLAQELVAPRSSRPDAGDLLDRLGLADRADSVVSSLSGGEQQRVAIARALSTAPDVLLADEPTGALDEEATESITRLLSDLAHEGGLLVVAATHDPAVAAHADVVLRFRRHGLAVVDEG